MIKTNFKGDKSTSLLQLSLKETGVLEKKKLPFFFNKYYYLVFAVYRRSMMLW